MHMAAGTRRYPSELSKHTPVHVDCERQPTRTSAVNQNYFGVYDLVSLLYRYFYALSLI